MQPHQVHEAIHDIGAPRQIADVLQRTERGEEDDQDRQEREDRADAVDQPARDQPVEPGRRHLSVATAIASKVPSTQVASQLEIGVAIV